MSEPLICPFKKNVGLGQCRPYIRDPNKMPEVRNGVEWHNCVSCARKRVKNPWSQIVKDEMPALKTALDKALSEDNKLTAESK